MTPLLSISCKCRADGNDKRLITKVPPANVYFITLALCCVQSHIWDGLLRQTVITFWQFSIKPNRFKRSKLSYLLLLIMTARLVSISDICHVYHPYKLVLNLLLYLFNYNIFCWKQYRFQAQNNDCKIQHHFNKLTWPCFVFWKQTFIIVITVEHPVTLHVVQLLMDPHKHSFVLEISYVMARYKTQNCFRYYHNDQYF